jgi:hypothetical protein
LVKVDKHQKQSAGSLNNHIMLHELGQRLTYELKDSRIQQRINILGYQLVKNLVELRKEKQVGVADISGRRGFTCDTCR